MTNAFPQQKHLFGELGVHFLKQFLIFCPLRKYHFKESIHQKQKSHRPVVEISLQSCSFTNGDVPQAVVNFSIFFFYTSKTVLNFRFFWLSGGSVYQTWGLMEGRCGPNIRGHWWRNNVSKMTRGETLVSASTETHHHSLRMIKHNVFWARNVTILLTRQEYLFHWGIFVSEVKSFHYSQCKFWYHS